MATASHPPIGRPPATRGRNGERLRPRSVNPTGDTAHLEVFWAPDAGLRLCLLPGCHVLERCSVKGARQTLGAVGFAGDLEEAPQEGP
ncbi:hypothetical protein [Streptomyces aureus]|uniref:hypothetical protein n=1 Tax=Streptomyces aureus TaxID=193461 RepID=UPI0033CDF106